MVISTSTGCETAGAVQKEKTPARMMRQYAPRLCEAILHPFYLLSICAFKMAMRQKDTPVNSQIPATFMCSTSLCRSGRKRLSLIQMILQKHLKAGFEKKVANRRCDCDGYRPNTLEGEIGAKAHFYPSVLPNLRPTCVREASPCLHSRKYFNLNKSRQSRNGSY